MSPITLDPEIIQFLDAPERSFRLMAIEKAMVSGDPGLLELLRERLAKDPDEECRLLLGHAIARLQQTGSGKSKPPDWAAATWPEAWRTFPAESRLELLESLPPGQIPDWSVAAGRALAQETDVVVASRIIRTFAATWPEAEAPALVACLRHERLVVRLAAIEGLGRRFPHLLARELPPFLVSEDPRLRILAIQGLAVIDPQESREHLAWMLIEGTPRERLAALKSAFLLPFETVRETLLGFVAAERDPDLLKRAGLHFQINPDPEVPYRLWEIAEGAPKGKAELLTEVIRGACRALEAAKALSEPVELYKTRLQDWIRRRAAARFVQECLDRLVRATPAEKPELTAVIRARAGQQVVREAFLAARDWPLSPEALAELSRLIPGLEAAASPVAAGKPFMELAPEEQIPIMASWLVEDREEATRQLGLLLNSDRTGAATLAAGLRAAGRLEIAGFNRSALAALGSHDPVQVVAGLEYLGQMAFDELLPRLGTFLKSPFPRVKVAALRVLRREDAPQAVSSLLALLRQPEPEARRAALQCLIHLDFPLLRDGLAEILLLPGTDDLVIPILCLFETNPDPESLYTLFRLERRLPPPGNEQARAVRRRCELHLQGAGRLAGSSPDVRESAFQQRWQEEQARARRPSPAYSVQALRQKAPSGLWEDCKRALGEMPELSQRILLTALLLLTFFSVYVLWLGRQAAPPPGRMATSLLSEPILIRGRIETADPIAGEVKFRAQDGTCFLLPFRGFSQRLLSPGLVLEMQVIPYQMTIEGNILAHIQDGRVVLTP